MPLANIAPDGLRSPIDGVVVRWRVKSASAGNPVKLRVMSPATDPEWGKVNLILQLNEQGSATIRRQPLPEMPAELNALLEQS